MTKWDLPYTGAIADHGYTGVDNDGIATYDWGIHTTVYDSGSTYISQQYTLLEHTFDVSNPVTEESVLQACRDAESAGVTCSLD